MPGVRIRDPELLRQGDLAVRASKVSAVRHLAFAVAIETLILSAYKLTTDVTRWLLARQASRESSSAGTSP